jgi:hypothetical protein
MVPASCRSHQTWSSDVRIPAYFVALLFTEIFSYFEVVKHPMDLSTISSKLKSGQYASRKDFADDFKLMLSNAYLFNPVGTDPHNDALKLDEAFQKCKFPDVYSETILTMF